MCRDRWSGRQSLPTPSSPRGQDPASRGRLHAGAKAVLLGTMALLGLVRLLHPGGPAILSLRPRGRSLRLPLEARKRARCPAGHMARRRPADDRSAPERVSNVLGTTRRRLWRSPPGPCRGRQRDLRTDTPWGYVRIALRRHLGRCYPLRALGAGDVRGRRQSGLVEGRGSGRPASSEDVDRTFHRSRASTGTLAAASS